MTRHSTGNEGVKDAGRWHLGWLHSRMSPFRWFLCGDSFMARWFVFGRFKSRIWVGNRPCSSLWRRIVHFGLHPIPLLLSYGWRIVFIRWRLTWNWEVVLYFLYFLYFLSSLYFLWLMSPLTHVTLIHTVAFRYVLMGCQIGECSKGRSRQASLSPEVRGHWDPITKCNRYRWVYRLWWPFWGVATAR